MQFKLLFFFFFCFFFYNKHCYACLSFQRLLVGIFSGELFSEGLIIGRNFSCVQKWVGLESKNSRHKNNSLKQLKTANPKSPWPYIREGSLSGSFSPRGLIIILFIYIYIYIFVFVVGEWGGREGSKGLLSEFYGMLFSMRSHSGF